MRSPHACLLAGVMVAAGCAEGSNARFASAPAGWTTTGLPVTQVSPQSSAEGAKPAALSSCQLTATLRDKGPSNTGRFSLTVTNTGRTPVTLVMPGDGSDAGWRTPTLTWTALANGQPVAPRSQERCGMMNAIEASEIFTLAAGASKDLEWIPDPSFARGSYELRVTYRNDPGLAARGKGGTSEEVKRLLAATTACEVTSNQVFFSGG